MNDRESNETPQLRRQLNPKEALVCVFAAMGNDPMLASHHYANLTRGPLIVDTVKKAQRIARLHAAIRAGVRDCERTCTMNPWINYHAPETSPRASDAFLQLPWLDRTRRLACERPGLFAAGDTCIERGQIVLVEQAFALQTATAIASGVADAAWMVPPAMPSLDAERLFRERGIGRVYRLARRMLEEHGWVRSSMVLDAVSAATFADATVHRRVAASFSRNARCRTDLDPEQQHPFVSADMDLSCPVAAKGDNANGEEAKEKKQAAEDDEEEEEDTAFAAFDHKTELARDAHPLVCEALVQPTDAQVRRLLRRVEAMLVTMRAWPLPIHTADALFPIVSCAAHACRPNADVFFLRDHAVVIATRDIEPGERITVNRVGLMAVVLDERRQHVTRRCFVRAARGFDCHCELCLLHISRTDDYIRAGMQIRANSSTDGVDPTRPCADALWYEMDAASRQRHATVERLCLASPLMAPPMGTTLAAKLRFYSALLEDAARDHLLGLVDLQQRERHAVARRSAKQKQEQESNAGATMAQSDHAPGKADDVPSDIDTESDRDDDTDDDLQDDVRDANRGFGVYSHSPFARDDHKRHALLQWFLLFSEATFTDPEAYAEHYNGAHLLLQCVNQALLGGVRKETQRIARRRYLLDSAYLLLRLEQHMVCVVAHGANRVSPKRRSAMLDAHGRAIEFVFCAAAEQSMPTWFTALCLLGASFYDNIHSVLMPAAVGLTSHVARSLMCSSADGAMSANNTNYDDDDDHTADTPRAADKQTVLTEDGGMVSPVPAC